MTGAWHILTPVVAPWVSWVLLVLLICAVFAEIVQTGAVVQAFATTFSRLERSYGDAPRHWLGDVLMNIFRIGTFAMALYLYAYQARPLEPLTYLMIAALVLTVDAVKIGLSMLVNYTFDISRRFAVLAAHYSHLWTIICCACYVFVIVCVRIDNTLIVRYLLLALLALAILLIAFKWVRMFYSGPRSLAYIALYLITLELLPLAVLVEGTKYIVG